MVTKQAAVMAYSDLFIIAALLASLGIISAIMIRDIPKNNETIEAEGEEEPVSAATHLNA
jgi:hypothetical protein